MTGSGSTRSSTTGAGSPPSCAPRSSSATRNVSTARCAAKTGCDRRYGLELDHDDPVANGGPSSYENLKAKCGPDHWAKTERDRKAGLLGGNRGPPP